VKPSFECHQFGPFVLPDTRGGRRIILRALRKGFLDYFGKCGSGADFAGNVTPEGEIPCFTGRTCGGVFSRWIGKPGNDPRVMISDLLEYSGTTVDGKPYLVKHAPFSRVEVLTSTCRSRIYQFDDRCQAWEEWRKCYDAARNRAWKFTKADKATVETMHAAIKREKTREEERERRAELRERLAFERDTERREEVYRAIGNSQTQSRRSKRAQLRALGIPA
jgi:hypothetical protein